MRLASHAFGGRALKYQREIANFQSQINDFASFKFCTPLIKIRSQKFWALQKLIRGWIFSKNIKYEIWKMLNGF